MGRDYESYSSHSRTDFKVTIDQLRDMHMSANATTALNEFGGIKTLASALCTDTDSGLSDNESNHNYQPRKEKFGENVFPDPKMPSFFSLLFEALKDEMLIILVIAAVVSLVLGIAFPPPNTSRLEGSIEGAAILGAVIIVSFVQAGNNWYQERQFQKLNKIKQDVDVRVVRNGENREVSIHELLAGDVIILESGNQIPVDGYFISGFNTTTDESGMTGESVPVKKNDNNRRMLSGTYVLTGNCCMLATCVGLNSQWGQALAELDEAAERRETPLQEKLGLLARYIGFVGVGVAALVFVVLVIYFIVDAVKHKEDWEWENLTEILQYFIVAVTIVVVAVPEGLPLAVTMALAYSLMKMRSDKCLVRYLPACETMGGATQICSDKTGTLTQNRMTVTCGIIAGKKFDRPVVDGLDQHVHRLLTEGIARNSTGDLKPPLTPGGFPIYVGAASECALLAWINKLNVDYADIRANGPAIAQQFPFSSARKRMSCLLPLPEGGYRMFTKGAPEIILQRCIAKLDQHANLESLDKSDIKDLLEFVEEMASRGFRTMAMAYRDFEVFDLSEDFSEESGDEPPEMKLNLIAIVGIEDPVRPEVPDAVRTCQRAGITVRMVTGDYPTTAASIARQCNILTGDGMVIEGPEFAKMSDDEIDRVLPRLVVLSRCAPADKIRLVKRLIASTELVAVTGDGTNDAAALRGAHIGLAMGGGTEVARDASDIIILDDNFSSIVKAVMWGRSVFDNIRKFLQFQLTVNVAAMAIAALSALVGLEPLTAVQLLWVNLIMDSLGALALATEAPTPALLERDPKNISHPNYSLISPEMWKMIIGQSLYQIGVLYGGLFLIPLIPLEVPIVKGSLEHYTIIFNAFIFCQLFNLVACRKVNPREYNFFQGFFTNWAFHLVLIAELVIQVFLVGFNYNDKLHDGNPGRLFDWLEWIGAIFDTCALDIYQWLACIGVGLVGFIWAFILRFIPTPKEKLYKGEIPVDKGDEPDEETPLFDKVRNH